MAVAEALVVDFNASHVSSVPTSRLSAVCQLPRTGAIQRHEVPSDWSMAGCEHPGNNDLTLLLRRYLGLDIIIGAVERRRE